MTIAIPLACFVLGMTVPLTGTVEDSSGKPVAGATVWLGGAYSADDGSSVLASAETDAQGKFRLERPDDLTGRGDRWSPTLWAFKPGSRVGHLEFRWDLPAADEPVRLALGPSTPTRFRILRPDGKPAAGARVRPAFWSLDGPWPPDPVIDRLAATTDADGRGVIDGFEPGELKSLDVTFGTQLVQCLGVDPVDRTATLHPLGRLNVRIVGDDPKALRGWSITASIQRAEREPHDPYWIQWSRETTGDDGRIALPFVAAGDVSLDARPPEGSLYRTTKVPGGKVRVGEATEIEIPIVRGVRVEGVVREEPGGSPIPGVKLYILPPGGGTVHAIEADARGRYSTVVAPGPARLSYTDLEHSAKDYYLPPGVVNWVDFEVKPGEEKHEIDPPPLRKAARVRGRVVDDAGEPVPGAVVSASWTVEKDGSRWASSTQLTTIRRGEFDLGNIAPGAQVTLSATSDWAAESEPVVVPKAGEGGPIALRLVKRPTLALSGRVLGADGRPLAGARIRVLIRADDQSFNSGSAFPFRGIEAIRTGPDGRFTTPAQLPVKHQYRVEAEAAGCEPAMSRWLSGAEVDVPDLALRRSIGVREAGGRVVDSAGRPVVDAEVFVSGDGSKKPRARTDADGRFRLARVPDATILLFVAKDGFRFFGRRIEPGARPIEIALRRLDEPAEAPLHPAASPVGREDERAIARELIAEARKAPGGGDEPARGRIATAAALVDPERMIERIENQVVAADADVLSAVAIARSDGDPAKVFEILDAIDAPQTAAETALRLFDRLGSAARIGFRRELLERAERKARAIQEPGWAAGLLARIADRRLDLGDVDVGSATAREALALSEKAREPVFVGRDELAKALARVDLAAALKLLDGQARQPGEHDGTRVEIAKRIAASDPAGARRILGAIAERNRWSARRAIAPRMAAGDLPAARALAAEANDPMLAAVLPAFSARALADSDPASARALLAEAIETLGKLEKAPPTAPSPAVVLARLVPLAVRIDPDAAPSCLWLALSRRVPLSGRDSPAITQEARRGFVDLAELAAMTSRYDRAAAEAMFASLASRLAVLYDNPWGLANEGPAIFRASGAYDARAARALLDSLPDDPPPPPPGVANGIPSHTNKAEARIALAEVLGLPPRLRLRLREPSPLGPFADDWIGDFDDRGMDRHEGP